jgi:hypothetical protein
VLAEARNVARGSVTAVRGPCRRVAIREVMEGGHGSAVSTQTVCVRAASLVWPGPLSQSNDRKEPHRSFAFAWCSETPIQARAAD